eukprot:m.238069 g.238069  ORF g.238069 m.238069 type:complete len:206 (+) comp21555_c0_seq1:271-888(+)
MHFPKKTFDERHFQHKLRPTFQPQFSKRRLMQVELGDHLKVKRVGYTHHGIVSQVDEEGQPTKMIHYTLDSKDAPIIAETSFRRFKSEDDALVTRVDEQAAFPLEEIVQRARSQIGESDYDLLGHNCEHFASWCRTGQPGSAQVRNLGQSMVKVGIFGAIASAFVGFLGLVLLREEAADRESESTAAPNVKVAPKKRLMKSSNFL